MLLIWGLRTRSKILARLLLVCSTCSQPAAQTVYQRVRWFTLFFIPLIPVSRKHRMQCAMCGHVIDISKEDAERLVLSASQPTAPPPQQLPPPQLPPPPPYNPAIQEPGASGTP